MKKGKQLIEELRELVEADVPPQFQKKNGDNGDKAPKPGDGKSGSDQVIKALRDTDYRDKDAFFKMVQLLKGLAVNSEKDETAKKFMSAVSDALTTAAKSVLGEDVLGEAINLKKDGAHRISVEAAKDIDSALSNLRILRAAVQDGIEGMPELDPKEKRALFAAIGDDTSKLTDVVSRLSNITRDLRAGKWSRR